MKVQIEERLIERIGIREWGLPTLVVPGQIWRSEKNQTITCMVASPEPGRVALETLPLEIIGIGELSIMPDHWRDALWIYVQACPHSGSGLAPFIRITETERNSLIRKMAEGLKDDIGCRHIAKCMGELASVEFETVEP